VNASGIPWRICCAFTAVVEQHIKAPNFNLIQTSRGNYSFRFSHWHRYPKYKAMPTFLDLPLPVREKIYRYALVRKRIFVRPFVSMTYLLDQHRKHGGGAPDLPLLCASQQVYNEAMPIYLAENTFSIIQADLLAAARMEYPRVFQNLKLIRRVEIVCDSRDYIYLAQFLLSRLPQVQAEVEATPPAAADGARAQRDALRRFEDMYADFDIEGVHRIRQSPRRLSFEDEQEVHERHVENMKKYLWGRTLTFVRQTFRLSHLYVDLRGCTCVSGCCRLADEVLGWGWFYVWVHGLPDEIHVRGTSRREKDVIASMFDKQRFHRGLEKGDIYDLERVGDWQGFGRYNGMMKGVYRRIVHG
jgi:hypothetical protein